MGLIRARNGQRRFEVMSQNKHIRGALWRVSGAEVPGYAEFALRLRWMGYYRNRSPHRSPSDPKVAPERRESEHFYPLDVHLLPLGQSLRNRPQSWKRKDSIVRALRSAEASPTPPW